HSRCSRSADPRGSWTPLVSGASPVVDGMRPLTRRDLVGRAMLGASSLALARLSWPRVAAGAASAGLPDAAQVRADFQRMVDFGPRLTGTDAHNRYIAWLEDEFAAAGCHLLPCDVYETNRWSMQRYGLELL